MPPKKKAGAKDAGTKFADAENLKRAENEIISLQRLLELRSNEALEARKSERLWRDRMEHMARALAQQKEDTLDISSDMQRQYKALQEGLKKNISKLEEEKNGLAKKLEAAEQTIQSLQAEKDQLKRSMDAEILEYKNKMEEMQHEFADMLRSTLDKMHQRLDEAHSAYVVA